MRYHGTHRSRNGGAIASWGWRASVLLGLMAFQLGARGEELDLESNAKATGAATGVVTQKAPAPRAESCSTCHQFEAGLTHPVKVALSSGMTTTLPLEHGTVGCTTCHDPRADHGTAGSRVGTRLESRSLCADCHSPASIDRAASHASIATRAHLVSRSPPRKTHEPVSIGPDTETKSCLTCHDGVASSDAAAFGAGHRDEPSDHPIGVRMSGNTGSVGSDFRMASQISPRIRLFDGTVGCGSCHSPYSSERAQLVLNNQGSSLCLSCHTSR